MEPHFQIQDEVFENYGEMVAFFLVKLSQVLETTKVVVLKFLQFTDKKIEESDQIFPVIIDKTVFLLENLVHFSHDIKYLRGKFEVGQDQRFFKGKEPVFYLTPGVFGS